MSEEQVTAMIVAEAVRAFLAVVRPSTEAHVPTVHKPNQAEIFVEFNNGQQFKLTVEETSLGMIHGDPIAELDAERYDR